MFPLSALGGLAGGLGGAFGQGYQQRWQQGLIPGSPGYEASVAQNPDIDPQTGQPWQATDQGGWGQPKGPATDLQQRMGQLQAAAGNPAAPAMTTPYNTPGAGYVPYPGGPGGYAGGWGPMLQQAGQMGAAGLYGMQKPMGGGWASAYGGMGGGLSPLAPWLGSLMGRGVTPWNRQF